jgi:3-isopropylmalate/(R)-2-methylmalate dehydratase large subunit
MSHTLYDKLVDAHKVCDLPDGDTLIYVDFHIMNEYTSPQAFSGLDTKGLEVGKVRFLLIRTCSLTTSALDYKHTAKHKALSDVQHSSA